LGRPRPEKGPMRHGRRRNSVVCGHCGKSSLHLNPNRLAEVTHLPKYLSAHKPRLTPIGLQSVCPQTRKYVRILAQMPQRDLAHRPRLHHLPRRDLVPRTTIRTRRKNKRNNLISLYGRHVINENQLPVKLPKTIISQPKARGLLAVRKFCVRVLRFEYILLVFYVALL
jgi:hypothetical protein